MQISCNAEAKTKAMCEKGKNHTGGRSKSCECSRGLQLLYCTTEAHVDILKNPYMVVAVVKTLIGRVFTPTTHVLHCLR